MLVGFQSLVWSQQWQFRAHPRPNSGGWTLAVFLFINLNYFGIPRIEPRASSLLIKHSITELYPPPLQSVLFLLGLSAGCPETQYIDQASLKLCTNLLPMSLEWWNIIE